MTHLGDSRLGAVCDSLSPVDLARNETIPMASAIALREDFSAADLHALARESRNTRQCRRLLALAAVADGRSRGEAAAIGGMDRQTLRDWVHRFSTARRTARRRN